MLKFEDDNLFEYKIIYSLLSRKNIYTKYEKSQKTSLFLDFISKVTYNTKTSFESIPITNKQIKKENSNSKTFKSSPNTYQPSNNFFINFSPGSIIGGKLKFDFKTVSLSEMLIPIMIICPFSRKPFDLTLTGITNERESISIDSIRLIFTKVMNKFGIEPVDMKVEKRGFGPLGQGEVRFFCTNVVNLKAIEYFTEKVYKIRGMAITSRVNSSIAHDMINKIKDTLKGGVQDSDSEINEGENSNESCEKSDIKGKQLCKNVKIFCDIANRNDSGPSPGYQSVLFGEGQNFYFGESCRSEKKGNFDLQEKDDDNLNKKILTKKNYSGERYYKEKIFYSDNISEDVEMDKETEDDITLDDVVDESICNLLESIYRGGAFDHKCNPLVFSYACLNLPDISKIEMGKLEKNDEEILELLKLFFGFSYEEKTEDGRFIMIFRGTNYRNFFKIVE